MTPTTLTPKLASALPAEVLHGGEGRPVVFLHGRLDANWNEFLDALAEHNSVYAPLHPGVADENVLQSFDSIADLVLYYDDLFTALELEAPILIGHGFGGMVAAEYAAHFPGKLSRLILIGSLGLWQDEAPITDIDGIPAAAGADLLFENTEAGPVQAALKLPTDLGEKTDALLRRMSLVAATNHFIWPIPDRGLARRLYRISDPTLLLWGALDAYVPAHYAARFAGSIASSETVVIPESGHHPHLEHLSEAVAAITAFLD